MSENIQSATEATPATKTTIERIYRTSVEEMWKMWTTKEGFESWWAPEGFLAVVHIIEACPNGKLDLDMIAQSPEVVAFLSERGQPTSHLNRCRFSEFRPFEQLELKILMDFLPNVETYENTILIDFFPSGEVVRMVVTLGPLHDEEFMEICAETLGRQFTNLEKQLNIAAA